MCDEKKEPLKMMKQFWKKKAKYVGIINMIIDVINKIVLDIQLMC